VILSKHHGLANDFLVVLDELNGPRTKVDGDLARRLCDRRTGLGADGLIHGVTPEDDPADRADLVMHLYNADGGRAEMSGNGIRCLGQAVVLAREVGDAVLRVRTDAGLRVLHVHETPQPHVARVRVEMGRPAAGPHVPEPLHEQLPGRATTVDMGNPHLVLEVDDPASVDLETEGAWLERQFAGGINVEVMAATGPDRITLRVWERGVGLTHACGTGACAAAHAAHQWGLVGDTVEVDMPGGTAAVELGPSGDVVLIGPAQHVATIEVHP
jgi:diaminopimelate epimerase